MKKIHKIRSNFVYPQITEQDRLYSASLGPILREDGDWRDFLPPPEDQNIRGIESSACYIEGQQHSIATLLEEQHGLPDQNFSARFNALMSGGTLDGGDPIRGAKSIKFDGLVSQETMPFDDSVKSWEDFHSFKGVDKEGVRAKGKEWLDKWKVDFKIEVEKDMPLETKYTIIREALKRFPLPISVCAWYQKDGEYYKPKGLRDNHVVEAVFLDDQNRLTIRDTYAPYEKVLEPNYDCEFAMSWSISPKPYEQQLNIISKILALIASWIGLSPKETPKPPIAPPTPPQPPTEPIVEPPKYLWDTKDNVRHTIRVICDEYYLSWTEKDLICAVIQAESGFNTKITNKNTNGSVDYGLCQINDKYWIGEEKYFKSVEEVLTNPEKSVRFMIEQFKMGHISYWIAFKNGSYLKFM